MCVGKQRRTFHTAQAQLREARSLPMVLLVLHNKLRNGHYMLCLLGCMGAATIKQSLGVKFHPQLVTNLVIVVALLSAVP
jgi:hypothetical protein